jgi:hypothetical protein
LNPLGELKFQAVNRLPQTNSTAQHIYYELLKAKKIHPYQLHPQAGNSLYINLSGKIISCTQNIRRKKFFRPNKFILRNIRCLTQSQISHAILPHTVGSNLEYAINRITQSNATGYPAYQNPVQSCYESTLRNLNHWI